MEQVKVVQITNAAGDTMEITLVPDEERWVGSLQVDGIPYHVEDVPAEWLCSKYCVDTDPEYRPRQKDGRCILLAPYTCY